MKYDFTSILEKSGKDSFGIDGIGKFLELSPAPPDEVFDVIPIWVADMNFKTVPTVISALSERINHPHFGYFI